MINIAIQLCLFNKNYDIYLRNYLKKGWLEVKIRGCLFEESLDIFEEKKILFFVVESNINRGPR